MFNSFASPISLPNPVMITGAAGGLGRSLVVEAAKRGWSLVLTDQPNRRLAELADAIRRCYQVNVQTLFCDLTNARERDALFKSLAVTTPHLSGLVNVAGIDFEGTFDELNPEEIQTIIRLNIEATLDLTRRSLELRHKQCRFMLITVSSLAAFYPMPVKATYAASKRFLLDFFRALKEELHHENVTVTVLCPAGLPTTPEAIHGIELQGFWGRITAVETGTAAAGTFDHASKGRFLYIPGLINRVLHRVSSAVPPGQLAAYIAWRWRGNTRQASRCQ